MVNPASRTVARVQAFGAVPLFWFILAVTLIARAPAMFSGFATDDYHFYQTGDKDVGGIFSQGRWGFAAMIYLLNIIGLNLIGPFTVFVLFAIVAQAFFVSVVISLIFPTMPRLLQAVGGGFVVAHPYWAEIFTFKIGSIGTALVYIFLGIALVLVGKAGRGFGETWLIPIALIFVVFSFNQSTVNLLVVVVFIALARVTLKTSEADVSTNSALMLIKRLPLVILFSGILYASTFVILNVIGVMAPTSRASLLRSADIPNRFEQISDLVTFTFFSGEPVFPFVSKVFYFLIVFLALLTWAIFLVARRLWWGFVVFGGLLLAMPLMLSGIIIILAEWWPAPRVVQHQGLLFGLLLLVGLQATSKETWRQLLATAAAFFVLIGLSLNAQVFADQKTMNNFDGHTANRIVMEIERLEREDRARTIVFRGGFASYRYGLRTTHMDLNISAFGASWSQQAVLEYNTGRKFRGPKESDREIAEEYCSVSPLWPSPGSIAVLDDVAVVCFGR